MTKTTLVSHPYELYQLLDKKYGEDMKIDVMRALMGGINGTFKGVPFNLTFGKNEYLLISIANNGRELLSELQPFLTEIMSGEQPICSYDMQSKGLEVEQAMPTIEWDIKDPEDRVKAVVNGRAHADTKLHNLVLYGDRKIETYIENEKAKADRIANARIYGIDTGYLSIEQIENIRNLSEIDLFLQIDGLGAVMFSAWHATKRDEKPADLTEEQYVMEFLVHQTKKFGVDDIPEPEIDKHIPSTPLYNAWYTFYNNHFKNVLTDEQWNAFQRAKQNGQDVSEFMPSGNWKDTLGDKPTTKKL